MDDDTDLLLALSDYLCQEGFQVETVETGGGTQQKNASSTYDVVLLDVRLPDRDGLEILNELSQTHPRSSVILLTAFTSLQNTSNPGILEKAFAYLTKPYRRQEVKATIHRACLSQPQAIGELPGSSNPLYPWKHSRPFSNKVQPRLPSMRHRNQYSTSQSTTGWQNTFN